MCVTSEIFKALKVIQDEDIKIKHINYNHIVNRFKKCFQNFYAMPLIAILHCFPVY